MKHCLHRPHLGLDGGLGDVARVGADGSRMVCTIASPAKTDTKWCQLKILVPPLPSKLKFSNPAKKSINALAHLWDVEPQRGSKAPVHGRRGAGPGQGAGPRGWCGVGAGQGAEPRQPAGVATGHGGTAARRGRRRARAAARRGGGSGRWQRPRATARRGCGSARRGGGGPTRAGRWLGSARWRRPRAAAQRGGGSATWRRPRAAA